MPRWDNTTECRGQGIKLTNPNIKFIISKNRFNNIKNICTLFKKIGQYLEPNQWAKIKDYKHIPRISFDRLV